MPVRYMRTALLRMNNIISLPVLRSLGVVGVLLCSAFSMQHAHAMEAGLELGNDVDSYNELDIAVCFHDGRRATLTNIRRFYTPQGTRLYSSWAQDKVTLPISSGYSAQVNLLEARKDSVVLSYKISERPYLSFLFNDTELKSLPYLKLDLGNTYKTESIPTGYVHHDDQSKPIALSLVIVATLMLQKKTTAH